MRCLEVSVRVRRGWRGLIMPLVFAFQPRDVIAHLLQQLQTIVNQRTPASGPRRGWRSWRGSVLFTFGVTSVFTAVSGSDAEHVRRPKCPRLRDVLQRH